MASTTLSELLLIYPDNMLKKMFNEEYIPWAKTGVLEDGKLRDLLVDFENLHGASNLLIVFEKEFLLECAKRFINS